MNHLPNFKKSILSLAFIASGLVASPAFSASASGLVLDQTRNLAFSALANGVVVLDIASTSNPALISEAIQAQGLVNDVFYQGSKQLLYVVTETSDLDIWDVQNESSPQKLSSTKVTYFGSEGSVKSVAVVGNVARVTTIYDTTNTFDVTDPSNPVATGFGRNSLTTEIVLADDGKMYRGGESTLQMTMDASGEIISSTGNQYFKSYQIAAEAGYVYASANNTLHTVSATAGLPFVTSIDSGNNIKDIAVDNDIVYLATGRALNLWDVSDKSAPYLIGTNNTQATNVVVSGDYAYVRNDATDFTVLDISIASNPIVVGSFSANGSSGGSGGGVSNVAPIADAGMEQGVKARTRGVALDGSNSTDLDGSIVSYSWAQTSGKSVSLSGANTATPSFRAPGTKRKVKTLVFELTVTDDDGASNSASVSVAVYPK